MRKSYLPNPGGKSVPADPRILLFSFSFFLGAVAGYFSCRAMGTGEEIKEYITQYAQVLASGGAMTSASLLCAAAAYYRVPCAVYLCGLFRHAFYLICGVFLLEGFLLSFAVTNFTLTMGRPGALISLCLFGIRALFILPIALSVALRRASSSTERAGRRSAGQKAIDQSNHRRCLILYPAILALGVMAELTFVPRLAAIALRQIL